MIYHKQTIRKLTKISNLYPKISYNSAPNTISNNTLLFINKYSMYKLRKRVGYYLGMIYK